MKRPNSEGDGELAELLDLIERRDDDVAALLEEIRRDDSAELLDLLTPSRPRKTKRRH